MSLDIDEQLARFRERVCDGKVAMAQRHAHDLVARLRADGDDHLLEAYGCPFCHDWHVGHPLSSTGLTALAEALRARTGNAPTTPGTGTTRRQRRKERRRT